MRLLYVDYGIGRLFHFCSFTFFRRNKKKRPRVRLVHPQGQALEAVGVDALGGHVDVGVVVHPKPIFFTPRNHVLFVFFAAQEKKRFVHHLFPILYMVSRIYTE